MLLATIYRVATLATVRPLQWDPSPIELPESPTTTSPQGVEVSVNPTSEGAPGVQTIQVLLDWLAQYSLWACLAALLAGGGLFAWGRKTGGHSMAMTGTALAGGGAVGVVLVGLAPQIVNALYEQAA